jgi:Zn-dependent M28 family amino/carboxypeptidase
MKARSTVLIATLLSTAIACAPEADAPEADSSQAGAEAAGPAAEIQAEAILADVEALSDDSMLGRSPGTIGEERAVEYIARRFQEIGLEPVGADYRLPVELVGLTKNTDASTLEIAGPEGALDLANDENVTYWSTAEEPVVDIEDAPLVFVGYGVDAPEYGWNDLKGEDLSGKVLLFLNSDPPVVEDGDSLFGGDARTYYGRWTYKFEQADELGAAGAIVIHTTESASYGFSVIGNTGSRQIWQRTYKVPMLAWMDSTRTEQVAAAMGTDLAGLFEMAAQREFRPVDTGYRVNAHIETDIERVQAHNVAGVAPGTDPELAEQYLVFTAHHDHLGTDPTLEGGDSIYNGALDNALGVASIMAAAEAFMAADNRRPVMFVSVTAEEGGLLGSSAFVADPPVPLNQVVANFNVDSPQPFGETRDVAAIGLDMSTLGETFQAVVEEHGLTPRGDPNPNAGSFYRSDQVSFAKSGVPALYLQAGKDYTEALDIDPDTYKQERYHQVTDELSDAWDLRGAARDMRILFETALRVANADEQPRWVAGNEFEEEWKQLYGKD